MGGISELIEKLERVRGAVREKSGDRCIRAMVPVYLDTLRSVTPVRTGKLENSERVNSLSAGGNRGSATAGPHTVYAEIINNGGIIHVKHARVLTDGTTFFGKQVTIPGQDYMGKARGKAAGPCADAAGQALARLVDEAWG